MIGNFATSKAGHDKGQCYVIVGEEDDFVYLCDGRKRTVSGPKRKRKKHIQIINRTVAPELLDRLKHQKTVRDEEIKYEIRMFSCEHLL